MPIYRWVCAVCKGEVEVLRASSGDREDGPDIEEAMDLPDHAGHQWERQVGAPGIVRGPGWGSKGNWAK